MIEVEIWDSGKVTKQGYGPITEIISLSCSERLNEAARWQFTFPAEDENANQLFVSAGDECYGYFWSRGNRRSLFGGEIIKVEREEVGDGGVNLRVEGLGRLNDLAKQYIDSITLSETTTGYLPTRVEYWDDPNITHLPNLYDGNAGTSSTFDLSDGSEFLYVYNGAPFEDWVIDVASANAGISTIEIQYFNGDWVGVANFNDGTSSGGAPFAVDGTLSYDLPNDWVELSHNGRYGYWARCKVTSGGNALTNIDVAEITVTTQGPDTSDIQTLMTAHGGGMSIASGTGLFTSTTNGFYGEIRNTTTLNALRQIADTEKGMFRIEAPDTANLAYMRSAAVTSNDYAVGPAAVGDASDLPSDYISVLGFDKIDDARDKINKLFAFGAGFGDTQLTLELADTSIVSGSYTVDTSESSVRNTSAYTSNPLEGGKRFTSIKNPDAEKPNRQAATQLLRLAYEELQERESVKTHLRLELVNLANTMRAGNDINIIYRRRARKDYSDSNQWMFDIVGNYTITEVSHRLVNGGLVATVVASSINRPPLTNEDYLLSLAESFHRLIGQNQPTQFSENTERNVTDPTTG